MKQVRNRRKFVAGASALMLSGVAGCSDDSGNGDGEGGTDDGTRPAGESTDSATEGATETAIEESSVFKNVELGETDLIVELEEDRAEELELIRVEFPDDERTKDVSSGLTKYRFTLVRSNEVVVRAGDWTIRAVDSNYDSFESVEFVAETNVSVSDVGTLDELDETGESTADEHNTFQVTFTNEGPMPASLHSHEWGFEYTAAGGTNSWGNRTVMQGDDNVLLAGESATLRYLLIRESKLDEVSGGSYQGTLHINWRPGDQTVVPLLAEFGDTVKRDSNDDKYIEDTSVSRRDA